MKIRTFTFAKNNFFVMHPISITAIGSISALGSSTEEVWANYLQSNHCFKKQLFEGREEWVAPLSEVGKQKIKEIQYEDAKYKKLDDAVLFALYASRQAMANAGWRAGDDFGINIGSSRGATSLFEKYHEAFIRNEKMSPLSSPTTTLGNISSWVGHDLQTKGPSISHSITCSTALHALLNGVAWLSSGMADKFLVGGSEAPLTAFTLAQMKALKIYAPCEQQADEKEAGDTTTNYPCQALNLNKTQNTMVLGEGAAVICLEKGIKQTALARIEGIGYATEALKHNISISSDALCFQDAMKMALATTDPNTIDAIVMHSPGTIKGDSSEYKAIQKVFCNKTPFLTTNKWKVGHTFGASGMLSVELALLMLQHTTAVATPFEQHAKPNTIKKVLVNAVGFGGNAVSVLLSK